MKQIFLIFILLLVSCVQQKGASGAVKKISASNDTTSNTSSNNELYWYDTARVDGTYTMNAATQSVIFLRGGLLHNFLNKDNNDLKVFCLVQNYNSSGAQKQLRVRAVPVIAKNLKSLRLDFPQEGDNQAFCGGTVDNVTTAQSSFIPSKLCPNCSSIVNPVLSGTKLYAVNALSINDLSNVTKIINENVFAGLGLRVNPQNNSLQSTTGSCSDVSCSALGYNCCIDGQCVYDGQSKPNGVTLFPAEYAQAMNDLGLNPLSFTSWPNIFYVCPNMVRNVPTLGGGGSSFDPVAQATQLFDQQKKDYYCLKGAASTPVSYSNCINPNLGTVASPLIPTQTDFIKVRNDVWDRCGCVAKPFPTTLDLSNLICPDIGLQAVFDSNNVITQILCKTPNNADPGPFQVLQVKVPARAAPHRFFDTTGVNYDDISKLAQLSVIPQQEGSRFSYLDENAKTAPNNGVLNMNSILGQMETTLVNRAQPAKMIAVELDQTYIITTTSGLYSACPTCNKDQWYSSFTAYPSTGRGKGLDAVGYTTERDNYNYNTTNGNYEDTLWGRACWVPPTMIPFSHKKETSLVTQRLNRLSTQAALFVNGYQRDWYGFNKGALIGSFDGVRWFAVGNGRRIRSTSTKLFLAINAPFADLADVTDMNVSVVLDMGSNTAADFDFDPTIGINDARQNSAATCQNWHQCNVDTDCITKLGWEYMCADVTNFTSKLPKFDSNALELANNEITATVSQFLSSELAIGSSNKRCVYRGAGALCKRDISTYNNNPLKQRLYTCAANFYCAKPSDFVFNTEVARTPTESDNILFGHEANVLGRPLKYIGANGALSSSVVNNIKNSGEAIASTLGADFGICRPGRALGSGNYLTLSQNKDASARTDFINQVGNCNSASDVSTTRVESCPNIDLNYYDSTNVSRNDNYGNLDLTNSLDGLNPNNKFKQNMCGGQSKYLFQASNRSAFKDVLEVGALNTLSNMSEPRLPADACLRRAGSPCHTNLDCGPNKMHSELVSSLALSKFGGTEAEQKYWVEYLTCGQAASVPTISSLDYYNYDITKNRCCREIGKELTMFTDVNGSSALAPELLNTNSLDLELLTINPIGDKRYSRYTSAYPFNSSNKEPTINSGITPAANQWKTINKTGNLTCCGGTFIRKFADGTNNWTINRLSFDVKSFQCLNYVNELYDPLLYAKSGYANLVPSSYLKEQSKMCLSPADGGCIQQAMGAAVTDEIVAPSFTPVPTSAILDTTVRNSPPTGEPKVAVSQFAPYQPTTYMNDEAINPSVDIKEENFIFMPTDQDGEVGGDIDGGAVSFYLPAYIAVTDPAVRTAITKIELIYTNADSSTVTQDITGRYFNNTAAGCNFTLHNPFDQYGAGNLWDNAGANDSGFNEDNGNVWCLQKLADNRIVFHAISETVPDTNADGFVYFLDPTQPGVSNWVNAFVKITFKPIGSNNLIYSLPETFATLQGSTPGNNMYYLSKLGRLELLGVPQIFYEPITCNSNKSKIVPNLFKTATDTLAGFDTLAFNYDPLVNTKELARIYGDSNPLTDSFGNANKKVTFQDKVKLPQIFSGHEFMCCLPLGSETTDSGRCCSGFAVDKAGAVSTGSTAIKICKLPDGADLNVYFNRFISSEGISPDGPGGGLVDADFVPETGEPRFDNDVYNKLSLLGEAFCNNAKVRRGGAFGEFFAEPNTGFYRQEGSLEDSRIFGIVDSLNDSNDATGTGTNFFQAGYRWNHHLYCDFNSSN
jgi:hypothetical protein